MAPPAVAAPRGPVALPAPTDWLLWPFESTRVHPAWVELGTATLSTGVFLLWRTVRTESYHDMPDYFLEPKCLTRSSGLGWPT